MSRVIMTAVKEAKAALRKELKKRLATMTDAERYQQSQAVANKLFEMPDYQASQRLCLYLHMKEEVQTSDILKHALDLNKECFIPQYIGPNMMMVKLLSMDDYNSLPETKWKIKQPADNDVRPDALETGDSPGDGPKFKEFFLLPGDLGKSAYNPFPHGGLDLILMPGLGFTSGGDRIGRGKGYYDTYLQMCRDKGFKPKTVALAYNQQICDSIPVSETDVTIDFVLYQNM